MELWSLVWEGNLDVLNWGSDDSTPFSVPRTSMAVYRAEVELRPSMNQQMALCAVKACGLICTVCSRCSLSLFFPVD